jgi:hypothetical protein
VRICRFHLVTTVCVKAVSRAQAVSVKVVAALVS